MLQNKQHKVCATEYLILMDLDNESNIFII